MSDKKKPFMKDGLNKRKYLQHEGNICPFCYSRNIDTVEPVQMDSGDGSQQVECHDCGEIWRDIVKLVDVVAS